jgi:molybdopterin synthase sulfur carrier subunit
MSQSAITITIKLFTAYQAAYDLNELVLEFPDATPVEAVYDRFISEHPQVAKWCEVTSFGINLIFMESDTSLIRW